MSGDDIIREAEAVAAAAIDNRPRRELNEALVAAHAVAREIAFTLWQARLAVEQGASLHPHSLHLVVSHIDTLIAMVENANLAIEEDLP